MSKAVIRLEKVKTLREIAQRELHNTRGKLAENSNGSGKVNNISMGLVNRITVESLLDVDFTYAPPFSTSIDPLISASRLLIDKMKKQ